jgi:alkaline phosphatase D
MNKTLLFILALVGSQFLQAQKDVFSGPMLGNVELRSALIWVEAKPGIPLELFFWKKGNLNSAQAVRPFGAQTIWAEPLKFYLTRLEPNTSYDYQVINRASFRGVGFLKPEGTFTTKDLWQWRKPAPDFSFLAGSCAFINEPAYDRPGRPYGGNDSIFLTMAKDTAQFMLWLGDNWYTREVDYSSDFGMYYRAQKDRANPLLRPLLKAMSHYAIWDDHDYGPNDSDKSFIFKETAREVFNNYWTNPTSGEDNKGIYTKVSYNDVDFFLLDDRSFRSNDKMKDSINGKPNEEKAFLGKQQMAWLKNALLYSNNNGKNPRQEVNASFKIICVGNQVLNPVSPYDKMKDFVAEYKELLDFIKTNKINGVVFMTGDRHHTEIIKVTGNDMYPLYDITVSPLTSGTHEFGGPEKDNPYRVLGVDKIINYGKFTVTGAPNNRVLKLDVKDSKGNVVGGYSINQTELNWIK